MYAHLHSHTRVLISFGLINSSLYHYMCVFHVDEVDKRVSLHFTKDERTR